MRRSRLGWAIAFPIIIICIGVSSYFWWFPSFRSNEAGVVLAPAIEESSRIAFFALGDQGTGNRFQGMVGQAMETIASNHRDINFTLLLGDNFYQDGVTSVNDPQWTSKFEYVYDGPYLRGMPFYAVLGNHDHRSDVQAQIAYSKADHGSGRWQLPHYYYVTDFGESGGEPLVRIAVIDTALDHTWISKQVKHIRQAFQNSRQSPVWKIVAGHHPLRSFGKHGDNQHLKSWLLPVLQENNVDLYLSAHDHVQELIAVSDEPLFVVSGGGGQWLYPLTGTGESLKFGAKQYGFAKVSATASTLTIEFFDKRGDLSYQAVLQRLCERGTPSCLQSGAK